MKSTILALVFFLGASAQAFASGAVHSVKGHGYLEEVNGLPVLHLKGTPEEMGVQYGYLLGDRIFEATELVRKIAGSKAPLSSLPAWLSGGVQRLIGWAFWGQFPKEAKAMIRGMVEGAKDRNPRVKLNKYDLAFLNSLIDVAGVIDELKGEDDQKTARAFFQLLGIESLIRQNCDSFAAWGPRTEGGRTFQTRNTDVETGLGLERFPLIVVQKQEGGIPFVSAGFVGQIGLFTGMNASGLGLGQVWAFSKKVALGTPWQLQMRQVFASARSAPEAAEIFRAMGKRTYGNNFVLADANGNGLALETTPDDFEVFTADDPREDLATINGEPYAIRLPYAVLRADFAMSPRIRSYQRSSNGPAGDPRTAEAYILRYKGQADRIQAYEDRGILITKAEAEAISRETAIRDGNLQAAVYANTDRELWVAYAELLPDGTVRQAYEGEYRRIPFARYLPTLEIRKDRNDRHLRIRHWTHDIAQPKIVLRLRRGEGSSAQQIELREIQLGLEEQVELGSLTALSIRPGDALELVHVKDGTIADRLVVR